MSSRGGSRAVLVAGSVTALAVLLTAQGCQRQSPRFDHDPSPAAAVTASVDPSGAQHLTLQLTDLLRFVPSAVVVHPGKVVLTLANAGGDPHTFELPALNLDSGNIPGHQTETITFTAPKGGGSYAFDCAYHTSEHMVGTLTVLGS